MLQGGFRIEILTYATDGKANVTYYLTPQDGKFVGADNKTYVISISPSVFYMTLSMSFNEFTMSTDEELLKS